MGILSIECSMLNTQSREKRMKRKKIEKLIEEMEDLPTLPSVAISIMNTLLDDDSSAQDVAEIVEADHSLTTKVLMIANSAFFGIPREVSTVRQAIVSLGFNRLKSVVLSLTVMDTVDAMAEGSGLNPQTFWEHSLMCAICAEDLAAKLNAEFAEEIFVAGLLHDIGKLVLSRHAPEAFGQVTETIEKRGVGSVEAERSVLDMDHTQVGEYLMDQWQFPSRLRESVGMHHDPPVKKIDRDVTGRMAAVICLADILAKSRVTGGSRGKEREQAEELRENLGISGVDLLEITGGLDERMGQIAEVMGLETAPTENYSEILQRANAELGKINLLLQESEERYRGIFESIQDVYVEVDVEDGRILEVSPSVEQLGGYSREEVLGKPFFTFYADPGIREELLRVLEKSGRISDYEVCFVGRDGEEVPCSLSVRLVPDLDGTSAKIVGTMRDITERKRAEAKLVDRERRLASVETLRQTLMTLSHHINNAMTAISGKVQLCERGAVPMEELTKICADQTRRTSAVLGALDRMVQEVDIRTMDFVGIENAMFDIEDELNRVLDEE